MPLDMGFVRGLITVLTIGVYAGIFWWAYRRENRERFEADALLPFADEGETRAAPHAGCDADQGELR